MVGSTPTPCMDLEFQARAVRRLAKNVGSSTSVSFSRTLTE